MKKRIIITGGYGYIGAKLAIRLKKKYKVILIEHPKAVKPSFLKDEFQLIKTDITDEKKINKLKIKNIYAILHLAAQSSGPKSFFVPREDINKNIIGTLNIINFCSSNNIKKFLFASSFVVYGKQEKNKFNEEMDLRPASIYAMSKSYCELLLKNYAENKGIKWNILRMFNVYGNDQNLNNPDVGLVGIFMNLIRQNDIIEVKGSLKRYRDLIHIDDVVEAWKLCLDKNYPNEIFNIASGKATTFSNIINSLIKIIKPNKNVQVIQKGITYGDLLGSLADTKKAKKLLNFEAKTNLKDGLIRMWLNEKKK
jgi:UDP-glucose 4-epimerase